jgi:signal peptidase I
LKTEEPRDGHDLESAAHASASNGAAHVALGAAPPVAATAVAIDEPPAPKRSRVLRLAYWVLWFALLPVVLSSVVIWALSPSSGAEPSGVLAWFQSVVRSQPVPVGIVLFTAFEVAIWAFRHQLPFAKHAQSSLRADLPAHTRADFERAQSLLDEAEAILSTSEKEVTRELTAKERQRLSEHLAALHSAMQRSPFDESAFVAALERAAGEVEGRLGRWRRSEVREYTEAILMAVAVAFALRTFVIEAFKIPSGSMIPTLMVGDHIFVNKFSYGPAIPFTRARVWTNMPPKRGDVMVFAFPEHPEQDFIKRVIAIEGDRLEARGGHPIVNGWEVPNCRIGDWGYSEYDSPISRHVGDLYLEYLGEESYLTFYDRASGYSPEYQGPYTVKKGEAWVMGDNRNNSHDSRMWFGGQGGGVPFENIRGRALFVWLSVSDNGLDWSRLGAPVMGRPRLPPSAKELEPALERCLKNRPTVTNPR